VPESNEREWLRPGMLLEIFVLLNLGFLTFDIFLAHSVNSFRQRAEYIPLYFSAMAPVLLLAGIASQRKRSCVWKAVGYAVGGTAILIGLTGVILHLDSAFFYERTIRSLTYSAPFAAPLAYTGLGFLLVLNRLQEPTSEEWARWVLFLTLGGFIGNFVFSLTDHAGNGFFSRLEWVPVVASAIAVGFLVTPLLLRVSEGFLVLCAGVLLLEAGVGIWGFLLHAQRNLAGPSIRPFDNFIYGAPPLAPLLFPNLVALGLLALWRLRESAQGREQEAASTPRLAL
jgi:hypothetical protein